MPARHLLLLIADDWSPIAGCYGDRVVHTPTIDALARRGTVFEQAFCTTPSCAASRASILTGQHSHTHLQFGHSHGVHHFRTKEDLPTLPSVLGAAGVRCALIGKNHTAPPETYPWAQAGWPEARTPAGYRDAVAAALAHDGPTFTMVAPFYPHRMSDASGFGLANDADAFEDHVPALGDVPVPGFLPDLPEVRRDLAHYYGAIARFDQCVGGALSALEASGKADQTLVVLCSDHGLPFPGAKASCYDAGHRCPLIIHRPGQGGGLHSAALVSWLDLAPTAYAWLGVASPSEPAPVGRSMLEILETPEPAGWDEVTFSHSFHEVTMYDPYRALRGRRYKYVRRLAHRLPLPMAADLFESPTWRAVRERGVTQLGQRRIEQYDDRPAEALYDLTHDPLETTNLIDRPGLADVASAMRSRLTEHRRRTNDPWLVIDDRCGTASGS